MAKPICDDTVIGQTNFQPQPGICQSKKQSLLQLKFVDVGQVLAG